MEDERPWAEVKRLNKGDNEKVQINSELSDKTSWELLIKEDSNIVVANEEKTGWELLLHQSFNLHFECFTWSDFMSGLILCFAPTALDIGTDFNLARQTLLNTIQPFPIKQQSLIFKIYKTRNSNSDVVSYCVAFRQMNMEGRANGTTNLHYELPFLGRVQTNIHAQFASFTYFFIALPGLILASKVLIHLSLNSYTSIDPKAVFSHVKKFCGQVFTGDLLPYVHILLNLLALSITLAAVQFSIVLATASIQVLLFPFLFFDVKE